MRTIRVFVFSTALFGAAALASPAAGQVDINARGGVAVPTFDIADAADPGFVFGGGVSFGLSERLMARANVDFGFHSGAEVDGTAGPDIDVFHYIAGLGFLLTDPANPFYVSVNAGAGALTFKPDVDGADSNTYFAINAGAEIGYWLSPGFSIFASPQGDIAFADEDELGTSSAWVWPFTAGLKLRIR